MATNKQRSAAKKNIKKAQATWQSMTKRQHSRAQPEGRSRKRPGTTGKGKFYRIEVRPKESFTTFRTQDVGERGHIERVAGKRSSGSWDTATWLVSKNDAHVTDTGALVLDTPKAKAIRKQIRGAITHVKGDVFRALPRRNISKEEKPTSKQRHARATNIKKAQAARWK